MSFADIKSNSIDELEKKIEESKSDLFKYRMRHTMGELEDISVINKTRKEIARLKTAIRAKQLGES